MCNILCRTKLHVYLLTNLYIFLFLRPDRHYKCLYYSVVMFDNLVNDELGCYFSVFFRLILWSFQIAAGLKRVQIKNFFFSEQNCSILVNVKKKRVHHSSKDFQVAFKLFTIKVNHTYIFCCHWFHFDLKLFFIKSIFFFKML